MAKQPEPTDKDAKKKPTEPTTHAATNPTVPSKKT